MLNEIRPGACYSTGIGEISEGSTGLPGRFHSVFLFSLAATVNSISAGCGPMLAPIANKALSTQLDSSGEGSLNDEIANDAIMKVLQNKPKRT